MTKTEFKFVLKKEKLYYNNILSKQKVIYNAI